ncbi:MAG: TlpA disulfide reductase family protein [Bacteroidota bacterium]
MKISPNQKWITFSNISTLLMMLVVVAMIFRPDFKAVIIQGLMRIGLFQPDLKANTKLTSPTNQRYSTDSVSFLYETGEKVRLGDLKGKVVFINFWASWCPPCLAEMPSIDKLAAKYKGIKGIEFLTVDVDGDISSSKAFMKKHRYNLPVAILASKIPKDYFSGSLPTTVIINKTGQIVFRQTGAADYSNPKISAFIERLHR